MPACFGSHDAHLNLDGEALCRFILLHTTSPPELFVKIVGTHEEVHIETFSEIVDGQYVFVVPLILPTMHHSRYHLD